MGKIKQDEYIEYLIDTYKDLIFSICYKYTQNYYEAEDLAQETFLSAYKNLASFDRQYEKAWLARIAVNKCKDYLKHSSRRELATEDEALMLMPDSKASVEEESLSEEIRRELRRNCDSLAEPYRSTAMDYFYYEKSAIEIAKERGAPLKTIQTQIYRARDKLRKIYGKEKQYDTKGTR